MLLLTGATRHIRYPSLGNTAAETRKAAVVFCRSPTTLLQRPWLQDADCWSTRSVAVPHYDGMCTELQLYSFCSLQEKGKSLRFSAIITGAS